jgi:demethylmenaquinone methyltransferase/2-methoxy-6-polyprenyl-1,4-benzoquinol methylase
MILGANDLGDRRTELLPQPEEKARAVRSMFDRIAPRYDLVNRVMTFGLDVGWRRRAVGELGLSAGSLVIDVACGTGDFCRDLEAAGRRAVGVDYSAGMLARARTHAPLVQADALALPFRTGCADGVTSGFALRNVVDLHRAFREMARVLRPRGRVALLEVSEPRSAPARAAHSLYFRRVVPLIGGLLSDRSAYDYLPASVDYLPSTEELMGMLERAGFEDLSATQLALGAAQLLVATRS